MPKVIRLYVRGIDVLNRTVGRCVMYLVFAMMGILLFAAITRSVFNIPFLWVIEMAQFTMAAYYLLGGAYTLQNQAHVRMDLLYEHWSPRKKAFADSVTAFCLIFYLVVLFYGGISSSQYALEYDQRNYSAWAPPMAPIKIIMSVGILLMLLQAVAIFFRDLATALNRDIQ